MSLDLILPFLRPIEHLIRDPEVSDILVNGASGVFVERHGQLRLVPDTVIAGKSLQAAVRIIARTLGDDISEEKPLLDSRLPDGSRVAAVHHSCSPDGTVLAIRKFHGQVFTPDELLRCGMLTLGMLHALREAVQNRKNILISGGTGTGKTTLLNALASFIPDGERLVVIEDTSELQVRKEDLVRLEARRAQRGLPAVTIRDLVKATLRLRPDRIIVGEVRGEEAYDLLQALNTGHAGSLCTIHANSAEKALSRFTSCALISGVDMPYVAIRAAIAEAIDLVVHIERRHGQRLVSEVCRINRYLPGEDRYDVEGVV